MSSHFHFKIDQLDYSCALSIQKNIRQATSSLQPVGMLEDIASQFAAVQQRLRPQIQQPSLLIFAGDHGIHGSTSVSTHSRLLQLVEGNLPVNRICLAHNLPLQIIDAGVNYRFPKELPIVHAKIGMGTQNILIQPAMSLKHGQRAIEKGAKQIQLLHQQGCNLVGFGNLSANDYLATSAIAAFICNLPLDEFVEKELSNQEFLTLSNRIFSPVGGRSTLNTPLKLLTTFGGYELIQMVGAMLQAAEKKMILLIDDFASTVALLVAHWASPEIVNYCIFCCETGQNGHAKVLDHLNGNPVFTNWPANSMGTGVATVFPLLKSALSLIN